MFFALRAVHLEAVGLALYRVASAAFVLSVALFVWRRNLILDLGGVALSIKPSDPLLLLVLLLIVSALILSRAVRKKIEMNVMLIRWAQYLVVWLLFFLAGSLWSYGWLGRTPAAIDADQYGRIAILGFGFFLLTILFGFRRTRYVNMLVWSFLSAVVIIPIIFLPRGVVLSNQLVTSPGNYTLAAFQTGSLFLGSYLVFPIAILFSFFLMARGYKKLLVFVGVALLTGCMLWTGSRGAWFSVLAVFLAASAIYGYWRKEWKTFLVNCASVVFIILIGFLMLPNPARNTVLSRIFIGLRDKANLVEISTRSFFIAGEHRVALGRVDTDFGASRGQLWSEHAREGVYNPFGLGPSYANVLREQTTRRFLETRAYMINGGTHNTLLQVLVSAGIGGFILFVLAIAHMMKNLFVLLRSDRTITTLCVASGFAGALVSATFLDSLELRWFWVTLALVVVICENRKQSTVISTQIND